MDAFFVYVTFWIIFHKHNKKTQTNAIFRIEYKLRQMLNIAFNLAQSLDIRVITGTEVITLIFFLESYAFKKNKL